MKTLYTAGDIERLASSGQTVLTLAPNDILTPLARDRARELGLQLRSGAETSPAAPAPRQPASRPPVVASGLAADALAAFTGLLQRARRDASAAPHLARHFDDLLQAIEQGAALQAPEQPHLGRLSRERRQALADGMKKMVVLGQFLFGPESATRRYDILWVLDALQAALADQS